MLPRRRTKGPYPLLPVMCVLEILAVPVGARAATFTVDDNPGDGVRTVVGAAVVRTLRGGDGGERPSWV